MEKPEEERVELAAGGSPSPPDSTPPRLVYHLPANRPEPAGMQTPPLRLPGSVPFLWEEAPGKPRNHEPCRPGSPSPPSVDPPPVAAALRSPSFHKKHPPAISFCYALPIMASKSSREKITAWKWGRKKWKMGAMGRLKDANWDNISPSSSSSSSFSSSSSSSSSSSGLRSFSKAVPPNLNILLDEEEEIEKTEIKATLRLCRSRSRSRSVRAGRASAQTWGSIYGILKQLVFWRTERKARDST